MVCLRRANGGMGLAATPILYFSDVCLAVLRAVCSGNIYGLQWPGLNVITVH